METRETFPRCPHCNRLFEPGATWSGANYCRGLYLFPLIQTHPGLSAWELSQVARMTYSDTSRALQRLRDYHVVSFTAEDRDGGGQRYRYSDPDDASAYARFLTVLRVAARMRE